MLWSQGIFYAHNPLSRGKHECSTRTFLHRQFICSTEHSIHLLYVCVQVTLPELKEAVQNLLGERSDLLSQVDDMRRVTEAAKRERVLAIDEKDKLLSK